MIQKYDTLSLSDDNTIANNNVSGASSRGIWLNSADGNTIANNIVTAVGFGSGVQLTGNSGGNTILNNDASGSFYGIRANGNIGEGNQYLDNDLSGTTLKRLLCELLQLKFSQCVM